MKIIFNITLLSCFAIGSHSYSMENGRGRSKSVPTKNYIKIDRRKEAKTPESNRSAKEIAVIQFDARGHKSELFSTPIHLNTTIGDIEKMLEVQFGFSMSGQQLHALEQHILRDGENRLIPSKPLPRQTNVSALMNKNNVQQLLLIKVK